MKTYKKIIVTLVLVIGCTYGSYELRGNNARGDSLGGALTTMGKDGNAVNVNPALLGTIDNLLLNVTGVSLNMKMNQYALGNIGFQSVVPMFGFGSLGVAYNGVMYSENDKMVYNEYQIRIGYGFLKQLPFKVGAATGINGYAVDKNVKNMDLDIKTPTSLNLDVGMCYDVKKITLGLMIYNLLGIPLGGNSKLRDVYAQTPGTIRAGFGLESVVNLGIDLGYVIGEKIPSLYLGVEKYVAKDYLRISGGISALNFRKFKLNVGTGINLKQFMVDYAFAMSFGRSVYTYGVHKVSIGLTLGGLKKKKSGMDQVVDKTEKLRGQLSDMESLLDEEIQGDTGVGADKALEELETDFDSEMEDLE